MSRRLIVALFVTALSALPLLAASDDACTRDSLPRVQQSSAIDSLFAATSAAQPVETATGMTVEMPAMDVIVARIGTDGRVILGCVDSAAAAKRFFAAPVENVPTKAAAEK